MRRVFVESNWVYSYSAPAHHKRQDAVDLLGRAHEGEIRLHVPAICLTEARQAILTRCQPRHETNALRLFLARARSEQAVSDEEDRFTRLVLQRFEQQVQAELRSLDDTLGALRTKPEIVAFPVTERMLELAEAGESDFCFCELDADLQPWDKNDREKQPLTGLYDAESVWVYGDFTMAEPEMPEGWPAPVED
jgi:hypothetical protein